MNNNNIIDKWPCLLCISITPILSLLSALSLIINETIRVKASLIECAVDKNDFVVNKQWQRDVNETYDAETSA